MKGRDNMYFSRQKKEYLKQESLAKSSSKALKVALNSTAKGSNASSAKASSSESVSLATKEIDNKRRTSYLPTRSGTLTVDRFFNPRFDYSPKSLDRIPWKSIALALFLLFRGCLLHLLSYFIVSGHMGGERSQGYGLLGLGILTFLPGFYETRIAYYSWRGAQCYRFAAIPDY